MEKMIFTNTPIEKISVDDLIGLDNQVEYLLNAIEKSKLIAVTGDFGSGKSSLINAFKQKSKSNITFVDVTLLQIFENADNTNQGESNDVNQVKSLDLFKVMIQSVTDSYPKLKSYINRKLSSYGEFSIISLNKITLYKWIRILAIGLVYYIIVVKAKNYIGETGDISDINILYSLTSQVVLEIDKYRNYILSVFAIWELSKLNLVFSLWDSQGKRKICEEDYIEVFCEIIKKITNDKKVKTLIVFIEDADRIDNPNVILGFLRLIHRLTKIDYDSNVKFVVSIKEESLLSETSVEVEKEQYTKIFDYILNINRIHRIDYRQIIIDLLNQKSENPTYKMMFGSELITDFPYELGKIIDGNTVNLRVVKYRLSMVFQKLDYLIDLNKGIKMSIESCANVVYLATEYPFYFNQFIKEENIVWSLFEKYKSNIEVETDDIKKIFRKNIKVDNVQLDLFCSEMKGMFESRIFDDNIRMYFYQYPKKAYILNEDEMKVTQSLSGLFSISRDFEKAVERIIDVNKSRVIIIDHIKLLNSHNKFPTQRIFNMQALLTLVLSDKDVKEIAMKKINSEIVLEESSYKSILAQISKYYQAEFQFKDFVLEYLQAQLLPITKVKNISDLRLQLFQYSKDSIVLHDIIYSDNYPTLSEFEVESLIKYDSLYLLKSINKNKLTNESSNYVIKSLSQASILENDETLRRLDDFLSYVVSSGYEIDQLQFLKVLDKYSLIDAKFQNKLKNIDSNEYNTLLISYIGKIIGNRILPEKNILIISSKYELNGSLNLKLFDLYFENNLTEKAIQVLVSRVGYKRLWKMNEDRVQKILSYFKGAYSIDLLKKFRAKLLAYDTHIKKLEPLFSTPYPHLEDDEVKNIKKVKQIVEYISLDNIDIKIIGEFISRVSKNAEDAQELEGLIFKIANSYQQLLNKSALSLFLKALDYKKISNLQIDSETVNLLVDMIYRRKQALDLSTKLSMLSEYKVLDIRIISELKKRKLSIPERDFLNGILEYSIEHEDQTTDLQDIYLDSKVSDRLEKLLGNHNTISVISKILKKSISINDIEDEVILNIIIYTHDARRFLLDNSEVIYKLSIDNESIVKMQMSEEEILAFSNHRQTFPFLKQIIPILLSKNLASSYFENIRSVSSSDEKPIVDLVIGEYLNQIPVKSLLVLKECLSRVQKARMSRAINHSKELQ